MDYIVNQTEKKPLAIIIVAYLIGAIIPILYFGLNGFVTYAVIALVIGLTVRNISVTQSESSDYYIRHR